MGSLCEVSGRGLLHALTGGGDFSHVDGWADAPPIFSFRLAEKRKRAVHGPKEKRAPFWSSRKCQGSVDGLGGDLLLGRKVSAPLPALRAWSLPSWIDGSATGC